jgi:hypothetical protein
MAAEDEARSRSSDLTVAVLRGRFQPFTRIHYECVKAFYQSIYDKRDQHLLIIGVVRDIEALATELPPRCKVAVESEADDYRHFPLFNPMRFADCAERIKHDIETLASKEEHLEKGQKLQFQDFCRKNVIVNLLPLKVEHLLRGMFESNGEIDNYLFHILKPFMKQNGKALSSPGRGLAAALVQLAFEQLSATYMTAKAHLVWLWPVIDRQDWSFFEVTLQPNMDQVRPCFFSSEQYTSKFVFVPQHHSYKGAGGLSIYGTFMYWALLKLQLETRSDAGIYSEIETVKGWCEKFVTPDTLRMFEEKMSDRAKIINNMIRSDQARHREAYEPHGFVRAASLYLKTLEPSELTRLGAVKGNVIKIGAMKPRHISEQNILVALDKAKKHLQTTQDSKQQELLKKVKEIATKLQNNPKLDSLSDPSWQVVCTIFENPDRVSWLQDVYKTELKEFKDCLQELGNAYGHNA